MYECSRLLNESTHVKKFISWPHFMIAAIIVLLIAWAFNRNFDSGFWITAAIVALLIFVNGMIAMFEDDRPDGFNVPESDSEDRKDD